MQNQSVLRYPGGKTRAVKILDKILNDNFEINKFDTLISPFFGGGSFEYYFQNKYNLKIIANDKFTPLYNFWMQVKENKIELYDELIKIKNVTKENFKNYKKNLLNKSGLEQAIYYFIINRCSFSGATTSGGFSQESSTKRFTISSIEKIKKLNLSNINFYNEDFDKFINDTQTETSIIFLDPPYYLEKKSKLYGTSGDLHENFDHEKLFNTIKKYNNWLITYNNCSYIKELYKNYTIIEVSWSYSMNKTKISSEIIILSKLNL